jgi:hypothetical protein
VIVTTIGGAGVGVGVGFCGVGVGVGLAIVGVGVGIDLEPVSDDCGLGLEAVGVGVGFADVGLGRDDVAVSPGCVFTVPTRAVLVRVGEGVIVAVVVSPPQAASATKRATIQRQHQAMRPGKYMFFIIPTTSSCLDDGKDEENFLADSSIFSYGPQLHEFWSTSDNVGIAM